MIHDVISYQKKYHPTKCERTVRRMIKSELLPSTHIVIHIGSHYLVNVLTYKNELYIEKAIEFNSLGNKCCLTAKKMCETHSLDYELFCKIVGV